MRISTTYWNAWSPTRNSEFKAQLARDPATALAGYDLTADDLALLASPAGNTGGGLGAVEQRTSKSGFFGMLSGVVESAHAGAGTDAAPRMAAGDLTSGDANPPDPAIRIATPSSGQVLPQPTPVAPNPAEGHTYGSSTPARGRRREQWRPRRRNGRGSRLLAAMTVTLRRRRQRGARTTGRSNDRVVQWVAQANGSLRNPQSGRCLDSPGGASANGTWLQIWDCTSLNPQRWNIPV